MSAFSVADAHLPLQFERDLMDDPENSVQTYLKESVEYLPNGTVRHEESEIVCDNHGCFEEFTDVIEDRDTHDRLINEEELIERMQNLDAFSNGNNQNDYDDEKTISERQYDNILSTETCAPISVTIPIEQLQNNPDVSINGIIYPRERMITFLQARANGEGPRGISPDQAKNLISLAAAGYRNLYLLPKLSAAFAVEDPSVGLSDEVAEVFISNYYYDHLDSDLERSQFLVEVFDSYITELAMKVGTSYAPLLRVSVARAVADLAETYLAKRPVLVSGIDFSLVRDHPGGMSQEQFLQFVSSLPVDALSATAGSIPIDGIHTLKYKSLSFPCRYKFTIRASDLRNSIPMVPPLSHPLGPVVLRRNSNNVKPFSSIGNNHCIQFVDD
jgi:hypothetical protein